MPAESAERNDATGLRLNVRNVSVESHEDMRSLDFARDDRGSHGT